jgi:hypothetical protein
MSKELDSATMVTYQFQVEQEQWDEWKNTVPRTKSLDERLRELIKADAEGRVQEPTEHTEPEIEHTEPEPSAMADDRPGVDRERLVEEVPGSGELAETRADIVLDMYDVLREQGTAEKSDMLSVVDVEESGYASEASVWSNLVKGRDTLRSLPGVKKPPSGRTEWEYTE